jgi:UDP-glucose 4-epimerase
MKIMILGSEGFVGKNLTKGLSHHNIFAADMVDKSKTSNYKRFDITNYNSVENLVKDVDVVIDLVAHSLVSSLDGSITNAQINIMGLLNLLEVCRKNKIPKVIFTSASSLIGEPQTFKVTEDHPAKPKTAYGITKFTSEHYLRLYNELYDLDYVAFRFFNIYGPYQKNGLIPNLYNKFIKNEPLTVFGKGDQVRDYVFIEDILPFFEKACTSNLANSTILNMGTGVGTTIIKIIETMSEILGIEPNIDYKPQRPGEIGNFVADTSLFYSTFGSIPKTSVESGLQKTIEWLKQNENN